MRRTVARQRASDTTKFDRSLIFSLREKSVVGIFGVTIRGVRFARVASVECELASWLTTQAHRDDWLRHAVLHTHSGMG